MTRRTATSVLFALAIAGAALSILLAITGGFSTRVAGIRLSAHGTLRPLLFALLTGGIALRLLPSDNADQLLARCGRAAIRFAPWLAAGVCVIVLAVSLACATRSAGGSDSYGYVSQARLWLHGELRVHQAFAADAPWPDAEWTFSPLGYRPAENLTIVPTYAPGLPLLMAAFRRIAGACGPFFVTPLCAAVLIGLVYLLGSRLSGPITGLAAALVAATSPTIVFMSLWSMSDVPAAAFWTAALVFAWGGRRIPAAGFAGVAAGAAIAVRPNLAPLLAFPLLLLWVENSDHRLRRAALFTLCCAPFIALVAVVNHHLYGSALQSGYGDTASLFRLENATVNVSQFSRWFLDTQGPLVFLFVLAPLFRPRLPRMLLFAFVLGVLGCYALYTPFHAWWFLRFVLPAFPAVFALAADVVWIGCARFGPKARALAMVAFTIVCMDRGVRTSKQEHVLDLGRGEQKYADVGRFIARELPGSAVVIAIQHSGSVRYYSGRLTLRYDWLDAKWLDRAVAYLESTGSPTYLLLEDPEIVEFREKFKGQHTVDVLDGRPIAAHSRGVYLYAVDRSRASGDTRSMPPTTGCE